MAKSEGQKMKLFILNDILGRKTDATHGIMVLQILSYIAQMDRGSIRMRQAEGITATKVRGVRFGAKPKEKPQQFLDVMHAQENGEISIRAASGSLGIVHKTSLRWCGNPQGYIWGDG